MRRLPVALALSLLAAMSVACRPIPPVDPDRSLESEAAPSLDAAGSYSAGSLALLQIEEIDDLLAVVPPFWGSKPYFRSVDDGLVYEMALPRPKPERRLELLTDGAGRVVAVELAGVDDNYDGLRFERLDPGSSALIRHPYRLFLAGQPAAAAEAALADPSVGADDLYGFGLSHLLRHPARHHDTLVFLERMTDAHPDHAGLRALLGYALVAAGRRTAAPAVLEYALELEPENEVAEEALRRLRQREPAPGEGYRAVLPFPLSAAFAPPTPREIASVRADWESRDLAARDVVVEHEFVLELEHAAFDGRILSHTVRERTHFGAVLVPRGVDGPLPVVLDVRGVDLLYSPQSLDAGTKSLVALGADASRFVFLVPALRGNTLRLGDRDFVAEGDPSDAWDGATDDTLALLEAALSTTPAADSERVAVLGYSRGGTVALLAGVRDPSISLVLDVVGPVDRFGAMDPTLGWTWAEVLTDDMRDGRPPSSDPREQSFQVFDHFFDRVVDEGEGLAEVRHRLLASSPLYFADSLPETHAYYGAQDRSVPVANPRALERRLRELGRLDVDTTVTLFPDRGHDTDPFVVQRETTRQLVRWESREGG